MVQFVIIVAVLVPLGWVDFRLLRSMQRRGAGWRGWVCVGAFAIGGVLVGVFLAPLEYAWSPELRACGFPFPGAFLHLEDGQWVDFITPNPLGAIIANDVFFVLVSLLVVCVGSFVWERARKRPV